MITTHKVLGEFREEGLGLIVADRRVDNNIVALVPVGRGGDTVLVADLKS